MSLSSNELTEGVSPQDDTSASIASDDLLQSTLRDEITRLTAVRIASASHDIYHEIASAVQRRTVEIVLGHCQGNQVHAARILGISRITLRAKRGTQEQA